MTKKSMALTELADKGSDVDILRDMLKFVSQQLMDMEIANRCNAAYGEHTGERETNETDIVSETGKRELARSNCKFRSFGKAAISHRF